LNTKQAKKAILELVDSEGGSIHARDKLIPHMARKLRKGEKCHETWPAIEHGLLSLANDGILQITYNGRTIRGIDRVDNDDNPSDESITPDPIDQKGITMTTETTQVGDPATELTEEAPDAFVGDFKALPYEDQLNRALRTLRHYASPDGLIHDASSDEIIMVGLEISQTLARKLNRDLWKLGLRKTIGRLKKHEINMSLPVVTVDMAESLHTPSPDSEAKASVPADIPSKEGEGVASASKNEASTSQIVAPITSIAQLEARFTAVVMKLEGEKRTLKTERDAATEQVATLERELKKVRKETQKLVDKVCGERDGAQRQLQLLRQAATQPLQVSPETQKLLAHYEQEATAREPAW
jgi:hypothetical protein